MIEPNCHIRSNLYSSGFGNFGSFMALEKERE